MTDRSTLVALDDVSLRYPRGTLALDGLSLEVGEGELVCLLGASGCGKTTALRVLAGLETPDAGAVRWPGGSPPRNGIGVVFQEPTLLPWASVAENAWLPMRLVGVSRAAARPHIDAALDLVGLSGAREMVPRELSGGMAMRASIARALVSRPRLLLMDEPFAALDEITRHRLNDDLIAIRAETGTAVVFVTHSVFEAAYLGDRIVVMGAPRAGVAQVAGAIDGIGPGPREPEHRLSVAHARVARAASALLAEAMGVSERAA